MFGGWLALIAVSFLAYRRATAVNRSAWLWALLAWVFSFGGGYTGAFIGVGYYLIRGATFTEREATEALLLPSGVGMFAGAALSLWLAGRNSTHPSQSAQN